MGNHDSYSDKYGEGTLNIEHLNGEDTSIA